VPIAGDDHRNTAQCLPGKVILPGPETLHTRITALQNIANKNRLAIGGDKTPPNSHANPAHARLGPNNNRQSITTVRACAHLPYLLQLFHLLFEICYFSSRHHHRSV
jgi:hypothetical protein